MAYKKVALLGEGACERLEAQLESGELRRLVSAGYPPADYPLNRGEWFETEDVVLSLDGSLYIREQDIYTGVAFPNRAPVYWEARRARAPRADI